MSDLFFTENMTTTKASNVGAEKYLTNLQLHTYAGQSDIKPIRIGNFASSTTLLIYTSDPNITFSFNAARGFVSAIDYRVDSGAVGEALYVKVTAPFDAEEGERTSKIMTAAGESVTVSYFIAESDKGDTEVSKLERFMGEETIQIVEQFEREGEILTLLHYDPVSKPLVPEICPQRLSKRLYQSLYDPAEWCNPSNSVVGYRLAETYHTKAFIGDNALEQNSLYDFLNGQLDYEDKNMILLPPDFAGFNPKPIAKRVPFGDGITFQTPVFQHAQWIVLRDNGQYGLTNIRQQKYFKGQFLMWSAELQRVNYPGIGSDEGFLPWNQLYDVNGKIVQYVKSWSTLAFDDPYCDDPYDPYCDIPYSSFSTIEYDEKTRTTSYTTWRGE